MSSPRRNPPRLLSAAWSRGLRKAASMSHGEDRSLPLPAVAARRWFQQWPGFRVEPQVPERPQRRASRFVHQRRSALGQGREGAWLPTWPAPQCRPAWKLLARLTLHPHRTAPAPAVVAAQVVSERSLCRSFPVLRTCTHTSGSTPRRFTNIKLVGRPGCPHRFGQG